MKNIIKDKRIEQEMTIESLSKLLDVNEEKIISWETGLTEPSIPEIIKISQLFKIEIDDLVSELAKQKVNNFVLPESNATIKNEVENKPIDKNEVVPLIIKEIRNKIIYNNKVDTDKLIKYFCIAILSGGLFFILFGVVDSQINSNKRNNPFEEEAIGFVPVVVGAHLGDEVIIGPLKYSSYDSNRETIKFSNPDTTEAESYFNFDEIEVYIGDLDNKEFRKWSMLRGNKLVYVKGISYHYINSDNFYIEAIEIKAAE